MHLVPSSNSCLHVFPAATILCNALSGLCFLQNFRALSPGLQKVGSISHPICSHRRIAFFPIMFSSVSLCSLQYILFSFPSTMGPNVASFTFSLLELTQVIQGEFTSFLKVNPTLLWSCASSFNRHKYVGGVVVSHINLAVFLHPLILQVRGIVKPIVEII